MKNTSDKILEVLKEHGYRITAARQEVCRILACAAKPLSIREVVENAYADEASVYRTIDLLRKEKLIDEIPVEGQRPLYELVTHHHHHAICRDCGRVEHLSCGVEPQPPRHVQGFAYIESHELTFYGLCTKCV